MTSAKIIKLGSPSSRPQDPLNTLFAFLEDLQRDRRIEAPVSIPAQLVPNLIVALDWAIKGATITEHARANRKDEGVCQSRALGNDYQASADEALAAAQELIGRLAEFKRSVQSFEAGGAPAQRMIAPLLRIDACIDYLLGSVFSLGLQAGDVAVDVLEEFWLARSEVAGARTALQRQLNGNQATPS